MRSALDVHELAGNARDVGTGRIERVRCAEDLFATIHYGEVDVQGWQLRAIGAVRKRDPHFVRDMSETCPVLENRLAANVLTDRADARAQGTVTVEHPRRAATHYANLRHGFETGTRGKLSKPLALKTVGLVRLGGAIALYGTAVVGGGRQRRDRSKGQRRNPDC